MQQKSVLILSVLVVIAVAIAALTLRQRDGAASASTRGRLFPELSERINDIAEVRLEKGQKSVTLRKEGGQWRLSDRGGYPAKFEEVKELAVRIADLEIEEAKTARKENHEKLGVAWPSTAEEGTEEAEAALVTLADGSGKELASLVVGKSEWRGSKPKVYARRASEDQVYLCSPRGTLDVLPEAKSWIEPKFLELANDRVQEVTIEHADGERVEIGRSAANHTQFTLKNLAPGQSERYAGVANGVAQALGYGLQLEDVRPASEVDFTKEPLAKTLFKSVDGLELLLETAKLDDKTWVRVSASYTPPPEPATPAPVSEPAEGETAVEAEEPATEGEQPEAEKKDVAAEAAELNQRLGPWAFEIGSYRVDVLARRMQDLLAEPAPPAEDGGLQGVLDQLGYDGSEEGGTEVPVPAIEPEPAPDEEKPAPDGGEPEQD